MQLPSITQQFPQLFSSINLYINNSSPSPLCLFIQSLPWPLWLLSSQIPQVLPCQSLFPSLLGLRYQLPLVPYPVRLTFSTLFQLVRTNLPQCCPIIDYIIMQYFDYFIIICVKLLGLLHGNQQPPVAATVVPVQPIFTAPTNVQPQQQYVPTSLQAIQTTMAGTPQQSQSQLAPTTVSVTQVPVLAQQQTGLIQQSSLNTVAATAGVSSGLPLSSTIHPVVVMQPATTMTAPLASVGQPPSSSSSQAGVGLQQPTLVAQHSSIPPIQQQQQPPPSQTSVPGSMTVLQGPPVAFDVNQQQSLTQPNHLIHQQAAPPMTLGVASQPIASNSEPVQQPIQPQQQTQQQQQVHHIQQPVIQQQQQSAVTTVQPHIPQQTVVPPPVLVQQQQTQSSSVPIVLPVYTSAQIPSVQPIASSVVVSSTTTTVTATSALGATGVLGAVGPVVEKDGQEIHAGEEAR